MNGINGSTNPRKRRLLLTTSTRKTAAAPPLPASVARLESLLDQPSASSSSSQKKKKTDGRANDGPARKKIKTTSTLTTATTTTAKYNETMCIPTAPVSVSSNNSATVRRGTLANITTSRPFHSSNVVSSRGATVTLTTKAIRKRLQAIKPMTLANREETRTMSVNDTEAPKKHHSLMPILLSDENSEKPSEEQILTMQMPSTGPTVPGVSFTKASNNRVATSRPSNGLGLKMSKPNRRPIQRQSFTGALPQDVTAPLPEPTNAITHTADDSTNTVTFPNPFTTMAHHPPTSSSIFNVTLTAPPPRGHFEKPAAKASRTPVAVNNDNFVRLNLKNNAGACRGARNKSKKFQRRRYGDRGDQGRGNQTLHQETLGFSANRNFSLGEDEENEDDQNNNSRTEYQAKLVQQTGSAYVSKMTGMDPMDEFLDGSFHPTKKNVQKGSDSINEPDVPNCTRHQRPCKLVTVKKNTTGNKGRKFYVCSMPRGEQCNHFQWADDTAEAARDILAKNTHHSSFIARQVAAHVDRFRTLTVPELQKEASRRNLNKSGKKQQLLMRLALWARDEIVKGAPHLEDDKTTDERTNTGTNLLCLESSDDENDDEEAESEDDESSNASEESSELELHGDEITGEEDSTNETSEGNPTPRDQNSKVDKKDESLIISLRRIFGHESFRKGQEWAVKRCLEGKKSVLIAPTGFGKSLCYALPAALHDGVCIVVSPLISLIQDQLRALPPRVPAATLSGSISAAKTAAILDDVVRKRLKILFVSPERLTSPAFRRLFIPTWDLEKNEKQRKFPEISLLCIDEAHCISQWGHNFRPCFLRFKSLVRLMKPHSILAITATAGPRVIEDIRDTLEIPSNIPMKDFAAQDSDESIKIIRSGRDNIDVKVKFMENQEERLSTLVDILTPQDAKRTKNTAYDGALSEGSVIIYVWRQKDTEVVAEFLNGAGISGGVVIYHGGMDASARAKSQSRFMRGKARICVATIAFGLGIDKADVEGVVHLYLSNSPEHYLQEIGRAGRDGRRAQAIALPLLEEIPIRHSLSHSNLVSKIQIQTLLRKVKKLVEAAAQLIDEKLLDMDRSLNVALPVQASTIECDCKAETLETVLSLIETLGGRSPIINVEGLNYDKAAIAMKRRSLKKMAEKEDVAKSILTVSQCIDPPIIDQQDGSAATHSSSFQRQFLAYSMGSYSFSMVDASNHLGSSAEPRHIFAALRRLQSSNELELSLDTTSAGRVFHLKITEAGCKVFGNDDDYQLHEKRLVDEIYQSFSLSSGSSADKVLDMHFILDQVSSVSQPVFEEKEETDKSASLSRFQELTTAFFREGLQQQRLERKHELLPTSFFQVKEKELQTDVYVLLQDLPQVMASQKPHNTSDPLLFGKTPEYSSLTIAKFLHGIESPRTPFLLCRNHPLFGKWRHVDFSLVIKAIHKILCVFLED